MLSNVCITPREPALHVDLGAAEQVLLGNAAIGKANGGGVRRADAELVIEANELHARRPLLDHEGLDGGAAEALVERRPYDDGVGAFAGGDEDLLAVDDVVIAVETRGGVDVGRIGARFRLGDGHGDPAPLEARELLFVGHRGDGGIAEPLARNGEGEPHVTPAELGEAEHGRHAAAVAHLLLAVVDFGAAQVTRAGTAAWRRHR